jgi:peptide/nickel transport system permease protein
VAALLSKDKRIIYLRKISQFWEEYRTKKIGLIGLGLLIMYVLVAVFAPWITPYDPISQPRLAQSFALPEWVTILSQYSDLTTTQDVSLDWNVEKGAQFIEGWGAVVGVQYEPESLELTKVELSSNLVYTNAPPNEFFTQFRYEATNIRDVEYSFTLTILTPKGDRYLFFSSPTFMDQQATDVTMDSKDPLFINTVGFEAVENVARGVFSEKGQYTFTLVIQFMPLSENASARVNIENGRNVILGHVHGILGADYFAKDIFAQLIYGARLSLQIGLLAAIVGTGIGLFVGVMSGYLGGLVDEFSMRVVDILLCLPLLPLLLALVHLYGRNVYYIVLFIAIFGWQGLARVIRSQTLSIRETAYIETARASGASGPYIMWRHIVPNIIPVAFASMVLAVPSAILFESALSFLGFGDPRVPTWGKMLQHAFAFGGFEELAWYWIVPPGLAIIGICLAFVFVGFAFDEIVNPRLRRRR